mgnify:CR=1 FL=1|tara:strand:- start:88 stop:2160 length:2073 start_codon:yes stop_codon:yes gene_type:complete
MSNLEFPTKGDTVELGTAISVINTGFLPFIPFTKQYKMGLAAATGLTVTSSMLKEKGKGAKYDYAWKANSSSSESFQPNLDAYNNARSNEGDPKTAPGFGYRDKNEYTSFTPEKFSRDRKAPTDRLMEDLRFTPNSTMAARSTAIAAELANIIEGFQIGYEKPRKEDAEMEEESILDIFYESDVPELNQIMKDARRKAEEGPLSVIENRSEVGLSHETYDWSIKDLEDSTKMHALLEIIQKNNIGDKLDINNTVGLEVTKDIKFFAAGRTKGVATNSAEFLEYTRELMAEKMKEINDMIKMYAKNTNLMRDEMVAFSTTEGHFDYDKKGNAIVDPHAIYGFTIQTISRAREAALHPGGEKNNYQFQFPMGTVAEGGPYHIILQMDPVFDQTGQLQGLNQKVGMVDMSGYGGARSKEQTTISNLLIKHMEQTLELGSEVAQQVLTEAGVIVGTNIQLMAERGEQIGSRFLNDFGSLMGDTYIAYTTMTATMTNKEISDALLGMIVDNQNNPENFKELTNMFEKMYNDSSSLTSQWKDKVGAGDYTVSQGMAYAKSGGPWNGEAGQGVAITPFVGSSRQMNLIEGVANRTHRIGTAAKNPIRRMTGAKDVKDLLYSPIGRKGFQNDGDRERGWLSKAFGADPSRLGFEPLDEDGVIKVRKQWLMPKFKGQEAERSHLLRNFYQRRSGMVVKR